MWGPRWLRYGTVFSILLSSFVIAIPAVQSMGGKIPYKMNIFRHSLGWKVLGEALEKHGYQAQENFLFADKYQMTSVLSFYAPGQKRAYFLNVHKRRKNQFSFWSDMTAEQKGETGFFVIAGNAPHYSRGKDFWREDYLRVLKPFFEKVEYLGEHPLFHANGEIVKGALLFKCHNYNGIDVENSTLY